MCRAVYWVTGHLPLTSPQRKWFSILQQTPPSKNFSASDEVTDASTTSMLQLLPVVILYGYWVSNHSCCQLVWAATTSHLHDTILKPSSPSSGSYILSFLSSVMCPELQGGYGMWLKLSCPWMSAHILSCWHKLWASVFFNTHCPKKCLWSGVRPTQICG